MFLRLKENAEKCFTRFYAASFEKSEDKIANDFGHIYSNFYKTTDWVLILSPSTFRYIQA